MLERFVANLTDFPAIKNFKDRLRFDEIIVTIEWRVILRHTAVVQSHYHISQFVSEMSCYHCHVPSWTLNHNNYL